MPRQMLTDEKWAKLFPILIKIGLYAKHNLRIIIEGILYQRRIGCPWRDLPAEFGKWNSIYRQFLRWSKMNVFKKLLKNISTDTDNEWCSVDSTYVKLHQHGAGPSVFRKEATGKSRGGNTSKIHMVTNAFGLPIDF